MNLFLKKVLGAMRRETRPGSQERLQNRGLTGWEPWVLGLLFFVSGAAALIYQVLWVRELGLLFGSTAEAAALTIAIFFAGIASGGWFWGRLARRWRHPLRGFAWLEIGVALAALGHFWVADVYFTLYPTLYDWVGAHPLLETLLKAIVAVTLLFPAAFLMGGTLPLMGQYWVRHPQALGRIGSGLYAINTLGGASGALAAGFVLPVLLGFQKAYALAISLDLLVGLVALWMARRASAPPPVLSTTGSAAPDASIAAACNQAQPRPRFPRWVWGMALLSGMLTLAVEVIWTRLFAQVLQNSVYTYALVLTTFLLALALGGGLAHWLHRQRWLTPRSVLLALLMLSALVVAATPWLFYQMTDGLSYLGHGQDFWGYVGAVMQTALAVMLLPGILLGTLFPYLLRFLQEAAAVPGEALGRLLAANTVGAMLGALLTGFVLLPWIGTWMALAGLAATYGLMLLWFALQSESASALVTDRPPVMQHKWRWSRGAGLFVGAITLSLVVLQTSISLRLPILPVSAERGETLIELREGRGAHVAVVEREGSLSIRVNQFYTLGSSSALIPERNQALIPLMLHPDPQSVFFLGMGTGISAGAALFMPVQSVVVCELLREVVDLARAHFQPYTQGLFSDPRVRIYAEDGRHCLARSHQRYDVMIADLFTPWEAGTGNLYTQDFYRMAAERLEPGGLFAQWIPLYQVSMQELEIIAATMHSVFPELTVWRGDLYPSQSIIALVGRMQPQPLDLDVLTHWARHLTPPPLRADDYYEALGLRFYAGNWGASGKSAGVPINTDNRPLIEYLAPRTQRAVLTGQQRWVVGPERDRWYADLLAAVPLDQDPFLRHLSAAQRQHAEAGRRYALYQGVRVRSSPAAAHAAWQDFLAVSTPTTRRPDSPAGQVGTGGSGFGLLPF